MRKKYLQAAFLALVPALAIVLVGSIRPAFLTWLDEAVGSRALAMRSPGLTQRITRLTSLADHKTIIIIVLVSFLFLFFLLKERKLAGWYLSQALLNMLVVQNIIKLIVARPRPCQEVWLDQVTTYSFPSGHAMNVVCTYLGLAYILAEYLKGRDKGLEPAYLALAMGLVISLLIAFSRLYLGVHYFTDVLAGLSLGTFLLLVSIHFYQERKLAYGNR